MKRRQMKNVFRPVGHVPCGTCTSQEGGGAYCQLEACLLFQLLLLWLAILEFLENFFEEEKIAFVSLRLCVC